MAGQEDIDVWMDNLESINGAMSELADILKDNVKAMGDSTDSTTKQSDAAVSNAGSFGALEKAVQGTTDEQEAYNRVIEVSSRVWGEMTNVVSTATQVLMTMTQDLLGGEGFGMFRSMIDPIAGLLESMGSVLGDLVGSIFKAGGDIGFFGGIMEAAGGLAESAGEALGKVSAAAFKFLATLALDTTEQLFKMFESVASSGLLVSDGLTEMLNNAKELNLTTEEYSELIKSQAANLTTFGGSVAAGAKQLSAVAAASANHNREIREMGITYTEQAEMTSEWMESMARTGQLRVLSDKQIADGTFEYMKNLRVVSALTGKSAEDMKKDRDAALSNLAFQAKLAKMPPKVRTEMEAALGALPEGMQQAFKESVIFGKVMTDTGAIVSGSAKYIENFANSVANGTANFDDAFQTFRTDLKEAAPELRENLSSLAAAGMAELLSKGNAVTGSINQSAETLFRVLANVEEGTALDVDNVKNATKDGNAGVKNIIAAMDTQRNLMHTILEEANARLPTTTAILEGLTQGVSDLFDKIEAEAQPGGAIDNATGMIDDTMSTLSDTFEIVKNKVVTAMDVGMAAFNSMSSMIDDIVASDTYQMFFGRDIPEAEQTKALVEARGNFLTAPSKINAEAVQESMKGASAEENIKTSEIMSDFAIAKPGGVADRQIAKLEAEIKALQEGPQSEGGFFTDSTAEDIQELRDAIKRMSEQQELTNARLKEANAQREKGNKDRVGAQ